MATITERFGSGHANMAPGGNQGQPTLATALRDVADDLSASLGTAAPDWVTGVTVTTHVATLATAGYVLAVEATTGTSAGPKVMVQNGSPAAGEVDVAYDANGIPTLTFNATDAITEAAVVQIARPSGYTGQLTIKG